MAWGSGGWGSGPWSTEICAVIETGSAQDIFRARGSSLFLAAVLEQVQAGDTTAASQLAVAIIVEKVHARGLVSANYLWNPVDDGQTGPWVPVPQGPSGPWVPVVDAQTGPWVPVKKS